MSEPSDERISMTRLKLIIGLIVGGSAIVGPVTWKAFQVADHEKRLLVIESNQKWQNELLYEIRGDVKQLKARP